jgi:hypothetical protein
MAIQRVICAAGYSILVTPREKSYELSARENRSSAEPLMQFFQSCGTLLAAATAAGGASAQESTAVKELIPRGKLRVGIVFAPAASAFFVVKDASGEPHGVTVDLAIELAKKLGVPVEFMLAANSGPWSPTRPNPARSMSVSCPWMRSARSASTSGRPIS